MYELSAAAITDVCGHGDFKQNNLNVLASSSSALLLFQIRLPKNRLDQDVWCNMGAHGRLIWEEWKQVGKGKKPSMG